MKAGMALALCLSPCSAMAQSQQAAPERCDNHISAAFAKTFAEEWIAAWNSYEMSRVFAHYTDDFEMTSPYILTSKVGNRSGTLKGKDKIAAYWEAGIKSQTFVLIDVFAGAHSIAIHYARVTTAVGSPTRLVVEVEELNADCKVVRSNAIYGGS